MPIPTVEDDVTLTIFAMFALQGQPRELDISRRGSIVIVDCRCATALKRFRDPGQQRGTHLPHLFALKANIDVAQNKNS